MGLRCLIFGHKKARLLGIEDYPFMSQSSVESGLQIRFDFCPKCGLLWGKVEANPLNYVLKEEFEVLSAKNENQTEKKEV